MSDRIAYVTIPIAGSIQIAVEDYDPDASDDELFDAALDNLDCTTTDGSMAFWGEWECLRQIVEGNIFHGPVNRFSVERES